MIRLLITQYGLPASHLSAAGYGEFHPAGSNKTAEGRAQNRRLDIVVLTPFPGAIEDSQNLKLEIGPPPITPISPQTLH
jgi:hypothetical protein